MPQGEPIATPPASVEAERAVLGTMLLDDDYFDQTVPVLPTGRAFYREAHTRLWDAMVTLRRRGQPIDLVVLGEHLKEAGDLDRVGGFAYLVGLTDAVPARSACLHYAKIVAEKARLRAMIYAASDIVKCGYRDEGARARALAAELFRLSTETGAADDPWVDVCDATQEAIQLRRDIAAGVMKPMRVGWRVVDEVLNSGFDGGLLFRQLGLITARSGVGKTIMTSDLIRRLLLRHAEAKAAIFSLEMERDLLGDLFLRQTASVMENEAPQGHIPIDVLERANVELDKRLRGRWMVNDTPGLSTDAILADMRRLAAEGFNVFVVDHLHIVDLGVKPEHARFELGRFTMECRNLAKSTKSLVIMPAQLSRAGEVGRMLLQHLAESDNIGRNIDWCLGLRECRRSGKRPNEFEAWVLKNRRGMKPDDPLAMFARWRYQRFEDESWFNARAA